MAASMRFHAEEWREVFGKSGGPVKLFVSGNHDIEGWWCMNFGTGIFPDKNVRAKYILGADTAAKWEDIWGWPELRPLRRRSPRARRRRAIRAAPTFCGSMTI